MWAASVHSRRWSIIALLGAAGTLALGADRPAQPEERFICAISARRPVEAILISRPDAVADCGHFLIETPMVFAETHLANRPLLRFRVLVPCAEMPRPMYSHDAGNAPVLAVGATYRLELEHVDGDVPWRAVRIDVVR